MKKNRTKSLKAQALVLLLCCIFTAAGCGRKAKKDEQKTATPTDTPVVVTTDTPTPTPAPTPAFYKQVYETAGREDLYRLPVVTSSVDTNCLCLQTTGDYVLFSVIDGLERSDASQDASPVFRYVLGRPLLSKEFLKIEPGYSAGFSVLFPDGSFLLEDMEHSVLHLYDSSMTEIRSYAYDNSWFLSRYLGENDDAWVISVMNMESETKYLYIPKAGGETAFGPEPSALDTAAVSVKYPYGWESMTESSLPATWYLHNEGDPRDGIAFPKSRLREALDCIDGNLLCGRGNIFPDEETELHEIRLYDLSEKTVVGLLPESELTEQFELRPDGILAGRAVILNGLKPDGSTEVLMWVPEGDGEPITGFCDFTKDAPLSCLAGLVEELKTKENIEITPDPMEDDGSKEAFEDILYEIDFANKFLLAKRTQPELFPDSGKTIHPENMRNNANGHYEFNPHVFSDFYLAEHGEARRQALYNYVDALRAGEEWFECPDEDTMWWCSGRIGHFFFPIAQVYTYAGVYKDGKGQIAYQIPKEEFAAKEREFETMITDIINNAVGDGYTDLEKTLALYEFLTEYCTYDYEMLEHTVDWMERQGGYRALMEKKGICNEFACLYQYLLLQVGVDAEESGGPSLTYGADSHAWVYVEIDGEGYLVDPTWGETNIREPMLSYFLFTDELREKRDGFNSAKFDVAGAGEASRSKYSFAATDKRFEDLWKGIYVAMDRDAKRIYYLDYDGNLHAFSYES